MSDSRQRELYDRYLDARASGYARPYLHWLRDTIPRQDSPCRHIVIDPTRGGRFMHEADDE